MGHEGTHIATIRIMQEPETLFLQCLQEDLVRREGRQWNSGLERPAGTTVLDIVGEGVLLKLFLSRCREPAAGT